MNKPLKILFFSNSPVHKLESRSTGNWVIALLEELVKSEEFILSVAFYDKTVDKITHENCGALHLIKIPLAAGSSKLKNFLFRWLIIDEYKDAASVYLNIINNIKPDIIQIFGLESPFIRIIGKTKQPLIIHIQGLLGPYLHKFYSRFKSSDIIRTKGIKSLAAGDIPLNLKRRIYNHLSVENTIYEKIEYCLGRTDWDRRCMSAIAPNAKYYYCQEIMREPFYHASWKAPVNDKYIFYTTIRDVFYKNVDMIYETSAILNKYINRIGFEWRVAGVTEGDTTPQVMRRKRINPPSVKLLGNLGSDEIIKEMLNANIFIYPGAIENSCNAVQEAMLTGIPIIATYGGGLSTVLQDNYTGLLVNEGDPYVLAGAVIEVLENYDKAESMGRTARDVARERHHPRTVTDNLINIYKTVLNANTQSQHVIHY